MPAVGGASPGTIVLIHGLWMTPKSWRPWIDRYSSRGYDVVAPAWPGLARDIKELRRDPSPLAGLGIGEIVDHYVQFVRSLDRPPVIMGHSFGGLITQLLLDRGLGASGVAISPAPPKGVWLLPWSSVRTAWPALKNPANRGRAFDLSAKQFRYRFGNTMSATESEAVYDEQYVPGTGRVLFQAAYANVTPHAVTSLDYRCDTRPPLLLIGADKDHVAPARLVRSNHRKYRGAPSVTDYKEFAGRSHYLCGEMGWEEVADYALTWAMDLAEVSQLHNE